jgi:hypothetical protein
LSRPCSAQCDVTPTREQVSSPVPPRPVPRDPLVSRKFESRAAARI